MSLSSILAPLIGGALIGLAAAIMLLVEGRIAGVSGIAGGLVPSQRYDLGWRLAFLGGLGVGGLVLLLLAPGTIASATGRSLGTVGVAGVLVGVGTTLGNGCTSGHGVCGVARLSMRSIVATLVFMAAGMVTVATVNRL